MLPLSLSNVGLSLSPSLPFPLHPPLCFSSPSLPDKPPMKQRWREVQRLSLFLPFSSYSLFGVATVEESLSRVSPAELNASLPGLYGLTLAFPSIVCSPSLSRLLLSLSLPFSLRSAAVTCHCQSQPSLFSIPLSVLTHPPSLISLTHTLLPPSSLQLFHPLFFQPHTPFPSISPFLPVLPWQHSALSLPAEAGMLRGKKRWKESG